MRMMEIWRAGIPGHTAHALLADVPSKSLFVSDGWGIAYPALRLHRLDPETGESLAEIRTRQQHVSSLTAVEGLVYVATHSRLLQVRAEDLSIMNQWDKVLPSDSQQLVVSGEWVAAANFRKPVLGLFHVGRRQSARLRVGLQPLLVRQRNELKVVEGFDGGVRVIDLERGGLQGAEPGPPVAAVAADTDIWGVAAGIPAGARSAGPATTWIKPGTDRLIKLGDPSWRGLLPAAAASVFCDDDRGLVWSLTGDGPSNLVAVSQEDGLMVRMFTAGPGRYWAYFDPVSGLAVTAEAVSDGGGYRSSQLNSVLTAHLVVED